MRSAKSTERRRDALAALSTANITFIRSFNEVLTYTREQSFFLFQLPTPTQYLATFLNVALLAVVLYAGFRTARRLGGRWGYHWAVVAVLPLLIAPLNSLAGVIATIYPAWSPQRLLSDASGIQPFLFGALGATLVLSTLKWPRQTLALGSTLAIHFSFLIPLEVAGAAWHVFTDKPDAYTSSHLAEHIDQKRDAPTVVWLLIDELDYRLLFEDRAQGIVLPNFDRLRRESIAAQNAIPPANDTGTSVPSLFTGKQFTRVTNSGPDDIRGYLDEGLEPKRVTGKDTIFGTAHELGLNTSIVGWYLPYCRFLGDVLTTCSWYEMGQRVNWLSGSLFFTMRTLAQAQFETATYSLFPESIIRQHRKYNATSILRDASAILKNPNPGFVYIHHMATHWPFFYDRRTKTFTRPASPGGYTDALIWADSVLGELRAVMEASGNWDRATFLLTSDHSLRTPDSTTGRVDRRVPWMLKLPGQKRWSAYSPVMHTVVTRALLEEVMKSKITDPEQVIDWLRANETEVVRKSHLP